MTIAAAFDLGSGRFKLLVASVADGHVLPICSQLEHVELGLDYVTNHTLSENIQKVALNTLETLKKRAEECGATQFRGVATAIFRKADNGDIVLQQLIRATGIPLRVISQYEEGIIGFRTALALTPEAKEEDIVSWDSGNASFQLVAMDTARFQVYEGPWGNSSVVSAFAKEVRGRTYTQGMGLNPITPQECDRLSLIIQAAINAPEWLSKKLNQPTTVVVGIGDHESIFGVAARLCGRKEITIEDANGVVGSMSNQPVSFFRPFITMADPETGLPGEILLSAVMHKLGISRVLCKQSIGSTPGILISPELMSQSVK